MDPTAPSDNESTEPKTVTREQLYEEIWSKPAMHLADKYGISGSFLARVCERLRVPRPRPGYWNKLAVGKASPKPPLPAAEPGDEVLWRPADAPSPQRRPRQAPDTKPDTTPISTPDTNSVTASKANTEPPQRPASPRKKVPATHPLIEGVIGLIPQGKTTREGYCKPRKRLLPDIVTSPKQLDASVRLANKLYRLLESQSHRVRLSNASDQFRRRDVNPRPPTKQQQYHDVLWQPERPTVVYIDSVAIGLSLFELCEYVEMQYVRGEYVPTSTVTNSMKTLLGRSTWTTQQLVPSGEFCLQAYSPYSGTDWSQQWRGKPSALADQLEDIVTSLEAQPPSITHLIEQARLAAEKRAREWEEERQRDRLKEQAKRRAKALETSRTELLAIIDDWNESKRIAVFFEEAMTKATLVSEEAKADVENRLAAAQKLLGVTDPLARLVQWQSPDKIYERMPKSYWEHD